MIKDMRDEWTCKYDGDSVESVSVRQLGGGVWQVKVISRFQCVSMFVDFKDGMLITIRDGRRSIGEVTIVPPREMLVDAEECDDGIFILTLLEKEPSEWHTMRRFV